MAKKIKKAFVYNEFKEDIRKKLCAFIDGSELASILNQKREDNNISYIELSTSLDLNYRSVINFLNKNRAKRLRIDELEKYILFFADDLDEALQYFILGGYIRKYNNFEIEEASKFLAKFAIIIKSDNYNTPCHKRYVDRWVNMSNID